MAVTSLKVDSINGGTAVDLRAREVNYGFNPSIPSDPEPGKDVTKSWNNKLPEVDYMGHDTSIINITGVIDTDDTTANKITVPLLGSFVTSGSIAYFDDDLIRPINGSSLMATRVGALKIARNHQSEEGKILHYNLTLKETKE